MTELVPAEYQKDAAFLASVERMAVEYERLTDAKLAKKIRHLQRAVHRCSLQRNVDLLITFHSVARMIVRRRIEGRA